MFLGACALGPGIRPVWEIDDPYALDITLRIDRDGSEAWSGSTSTAALHRRYDELVEYLMRADLHPDGVVLSTGTCLVPEAPFSLAAGDRVRIGVEGIGALTTSVARGLSSSR
jgi:2-dehydro-3-deoxy-D-arabinonate dehydratase